jgi:diguanylate cyclase (GGDEF)-like protein
VPDSRVHVTPIASALRRRRESDERTAAFAGRFHEALRSGDGTAADLLIEEALAADLSPEVIQSFVITPAMAGIGDLWQRGELGIADEHLATYITQHAMVRLTESMSGDRGRVRAGPTVLLAAVEGQHHVLGLRMIADVLESVGYDVLYLGADVPVASLRAFALEHRPALAGLGFGVSSNIRCLADSIWALHEVSPDTRIMLGGQSVPMDLRSTYPYVAASTDVRSTVQAILASPAQPVPRLVELLRSDSAPSPLDDEEPGESEAVAAWMASAEDQPVDLSREQFRRSQSYRELAFRDPLTDLANRRAFDDQLRAITRLGAVAAAVMMIDVDRLKRVNDIQGHDVGDRVLRAIAQTISDCVRPGDLVARVGGDEFAVLFPATTIEKAAELGERIRAAIHHDPALPVTISIGIGALTDDSRAAVLAADTALYEAKTAGRNCVVVHSARSDIH